MGREIESNDGYIGMTIVISDGEPTVDPTTILYVINGQRNGKHPYCESAAGKAVAKSAGMR